MVKVLPCHNFKSQRVLCPRDEPITISCFQRNLWIATAKSTIEFYTLEGDIETYESTFSTLGAVHDMIYCPQGDFILTLESYNSPNDIEKKRAIVYKNWRSAKPGTSVRVFKAMSFQEASHFGSTFVEFDWQSIKTSTKTDYQHQKHDHLNKDIRADNLTGEFLEAYKIQGEPACINVDKSSGSIAVGSGYTVSLYQFDPKTGEAETSTLFNLVCVLELNISFQVTDISLCEEFIMCRSESDIQVIQLTVRNQAQDDNLLSFLHSRNEAYRKHKSNFSFVSDYLKENLVCSSQQKLRSDTIESVQSDGPVYENVTRNLKGRLMSASTCKCKPGKRENDSGFWATCDERHVNIISSLKDDSTKDITFEKQMESNLLTNLFRSFDAQTITSSQLMPIYSETDDHNTDGEQCRLLSNRRQHLLGVLCFISTDTEGLLYLVGGKRTRLVQTYSYTTQGAQQVDLTTQHAYVLMPNGIEIYSVDGVAKAMYDAGIKDQTIWQLEREACMVGRQPFMSVHAMTTSEACLVVLCKAHTGDEWGHEALTSATGRGFCAPVAPSACWSIYVLDLPHADIVLKDMRELCEFHQKRSDALYVYLLEEMYYAIRGQCLLMSSGGEALRETQQELHRVALALAQFYSRRGCADWKRALVYYLTSQVPVSQVVAQAVESAEDPGRGLWNFIDFCIFNSTMCDELTNTDIDNIIALLQRWRPSAVSLAVISSSCLVNRMSREVMAKIGGALECKIKDFKFYCDIDKLALCAMCSELGNIELMSEIVSSFEEKRLIEWCTVYPRLVVNLQTQTLSKMLYVIHAVYPEAVSQIFMILHEQKMLDLALLKKLFTCSDKLPPSADVVLKSVFTGILEKLACDSKYSSWFSQIFLALVEIYLDQIALRDKVMLTQSSKYIIPKRAGLFSKRHEWLNDIPPLQGTSALTRGCENKDAENGTQSSCPCTLCNATLLKLQCLLCSDEISVDCLRHIYINIPSGCAAQTYGKDSIRIQCLLRLDLTECIGILMTRYPHLVPIVINDSLLVSESMLKKTAEHYLQVYTKRDLEGAETNDGTLQEVVHALARILPPKHLLVIMKNSDDKKTFRDILLASVRANSAKSLHQNIMHFADKLIDDHVTDVR